MFLPLSLIIGQFTLIFKLTTLEFLFISIGVLCCNKTKTKQCRYSVLLKVHTILNEYPLSSSITADFFHNRT